MIVHNITKGVVLYMTRGAAGCCLQLNDTKILLDDDVAEKIMTHYLPESGLVWSVNTEAGCDIFHSPLHPDWSVRPHPAKWVAGNIYHSTKAEAEEALTQALKTRLSVLKMRYEMSTAVLASKLHELSSK